MSIITGCVFGFIAWFLSRYLIAGFYTVDQNERAVKTSFGRAERIGNQTTLDDPISASLTDDGKGATVIRRCASSRPAARISNGRGKRVYKVSIATRR